MNEWEDDLGRPKPPWRGEEIAFYLILVATLLVIVYS